MKFVQRFSQSEEGEKESTPVAETSTEQMDEEIEFTPPTPIRRGGPKSPGAGNLKLHVENMNEQQLEQALETINENPTTTTIIDNNGNTVDKINEKFTQPQSEQERTGGRSRIREVTPGDKHSGRRAMIQKYHLELYVYS